MADTPPRFDAERARAAANRRRYHEIREALQQIHVAVRSADHTITVHLGVGGAVLDIDLDPAALELTPRQLSKALVTAISRGAQQVAGLTNEIVSPYLAASEIDLAALSAGQLPPSAQQPEKSDIAREIERASSVPKRPRGRFTETQVVEELNLWPNDEELEEEA